MSTARKWINVAVAMESAAVTPAAITGISKAAEAVVTATNSLTDGEYVKLAVQGMFQLDGRIFRVKTASGSAFHLEGENTSNYDDFAATGSTFSKITFGTSITTATTISSSGGDFDFIDTTTIHQNAKTQIPGLPSAASFQMDNIWDVSDAGLLAMKVAADNQSQKAFKFTFGAGGQIMVFNGYVGASLLPGGTAQGLVTTKSVVTLFGRPSYYES